MTKRGAMERSFDNVHPLLATGAEGFRLLADAVEECAIAMLFPSGHVATWNAGAERIYGYRAEEIVGQHFSKLFVEEDVRLGKLARTLAATSSETRTNDQSWQVRKDGSRFWASVVITSLVDRDGQLLGFATLTRDLSERRDAERERLLLAQQSAAREAAELAFSRLAKLQALTAAIAAAATPESLAATIVQNGAIAIQACAGLFARPRGDALRVISSYGIGEGALAGREVPLDTPSPAAEAFRTRTAIWIESTAELRSRYPEVAELVGDVAALCALPVMLAGRELGVLVFGFPGEQDFSGVERALMQTFIAQAAQAIDRADGFAREVAARRRLEALGQLTEALAAAVSPQDVVEVVLRDAMRIAGADICTLYLLDAETKALELVGERGCDPDILPAIRRITPENDPTYEVLRTRKGLWVEGRDDPSRILPQIARASCSRRAQAFWCQPLIAENEPIGLLGMGFMSPRKFPSEEREFVETFTRDCTEAVLRSRHLEAERIARTRAEALQASLATTLRSIADAVITTDSRGAVTLMNAVAEHLTGWSETEARGRGLDEIFRLVHEETGAPIQSPVARVLETGSTADSSLHAVLVARDGRSRTPIEESGAPIRGREAQIEGVVLVFRDVSQRKSELMRQALLADAAAILTESFDPEATLGRVAEFATRGFAQFCAIDIVDETRGVTSRAAAAHVEPVDVDELRAWSIAHPPAPDEPTGIARALESGRPQLYEAESDAALRTVRDTRRARTTPRAAVSVPLIARGRVLGVMTFVLEGRRERAEADLRFSEELGRRCAIAIDNARLYAAEQRARQSADTANRAKDEFLAMVSHELRTPLNAILGWAKLLVARKVQAAKQEQALSTIERNAVAMAQLIEDLLDVSRIISGKMRLNIQEMEVLSAVEGAIDSSRPAAQARDIQLVSSFAPDVGCIIGDPSRVQQIVWNLLSNAVKFTPNGGRIEIAVTRQDGEVEICVTDTGKGIDREFLPHIFDPFRQDQSGLQRSRGGLGLGLAIVKQLAELHGGSIEARSEGAGRGATFLVKLRAAAQPVGGPRSERVRRDMTAPVPADRPSQLRGLRVLVVDDDQDSLELVCSLLEQFGSTVTAAEGVDQAMNALEHSSFDVLISDIGMPGQDGYDLIRRVRALPAARGGTLPAAALTAYGRAEDRRRALSAGFSMHMPKPIEPSQLVAAVVSLTTFSSPQQPSPA